MLKLLLKKQLLEIFQVYYYDAKKNKARSKVSTILHFLLFALLVFGLLGGIFTFLAVKLCPPLLAADGLAIFCADGTDLRAVGCFRQRV